MDYDKKNKKKTEIELFQEKFETVCSSLKEVKKDNYGFYWEYYAPYFIAMKDENLIETLSYLILLDIYRKRTFIQPFRSVNLSNDKPTKFKKAP